MAGVTLRCRWGACTATGSTDKELFQHLDEHFEPGRFHCRWTGCVYSIERTDQSTFRRHTITHTSYKPHECPKAGCDARFQRGAVRDEHVARMHSHRGAATRAVAPPLAMCCGWQGCARTLPDPQRLLEHLRNEHMRASHSRCKWRGCDRQLQSNRTGHLRTHLPEWFQPFPCEAPDCTRAFKSPAALGTHRHHAHARTRKRRGPTADTGGRRKRRKLRSTHVSADEDEGEPAGDGDSKSFDSAKEAINACKAVQYADAEEEEEEEQEEEEEEEKEQEGDKVVQSGRGLMPDGGGVTIALQRLEQRLRVAEGKIEVLEQENRELKRWENGSNTSCEL